MTTVTPDPDQVEDSGPEPFHGTSELIGTPASEIEPADEADWDDAFQWVIGPEPSGIDLTPFARSGTA